MKLIVYIDFDVLILVPINQSKRAWVYAVVLSPIKSAFIHVDAFVC